ncbi:helix-turn-helix domain-containing protein [Stappia stellulata]|uniref:helix-turn-helix domain-containing protein n=1 Tax=Stappia stellulata TaxID=71235 RepID=UPI0004004E92|nr:helix-turn-helix domain-containing protein [Stappia stellulata]
MATHGAERDRQASTPVTIETNPLAADDVRAALQRLLAVPALARAPKISRLLVYLVEAHLDADPDALSEAVVAEAVFDQHDNFNPRSNPIVRVNASRLRNVLRKHFAGAGAGEPVHIHLARIGYALEIHRRPPAVAVDATAPLPHPANETASVPAPPEAPRAAPTPAVRATTFDRLKQKLRAPVSLGVVIALLIAVSMLSVAYTHLVHSTMTSSGEMSSIASATP